MNQLPEGICIVEYNQRQRLFHFNDGNHTENTCGWRSLGSTSIDEAIAFTEFIDKKYAKNRVTGIYPELSVVKLEYELWHKLKDYRRKLAGRI